MRCWSGYFEREINKDGITMTDTGESPKAPPPREMIDLDHRTRWVLGSIHPHYSAHLLSLSCVGIMLYSGVFIWFVCCTQYNEKENTHVL